METLMGCLGRTSLIALLLGALLAPAGFYVAQWLQSFREFPPRQKPGSFNLDSVMEEITSGAVVGNN
jgi:hypothetical protein